MLPRMGKMVRVLEGRFGRLVLTDLEPQERVEASSGPAIILQHGQDAVLFLNPGELHVVLGATRLIAFHAAVDWLASSFPAVFGADSPRPFPVPSEPVTPRIRQLADALAVEVLNDRFLSTERVEFMLQELVLSIVETYLARRRA